MALGNFKVWRALLHTSCVGLYLIGGSIEAATITVDTLADASPSNTGDGLCSLREAIAAASTNQSVDTCTAGSLGASDQIEISTALLPAPADPFFIQLQAEIVVGDGDDDVTISGPPQRRLGLNADQIDRVFRVGSDNANVTFQGLGIRNYNGDRDIVLITRAQQVVFRNVDFSDNRIDSISVRGTIGLNITAPMTVVIEDSLFGSNEKSAVQARVNGGVGQLTIRNTRFVGNSSDASGSGLYVDIFDGAMDLSIADSSFTNNTSRLDGGALRVRAPNGNEQLSVSIDRSLFYQNTAQSGSGGAIAINNAAVTVRNSTIIDNLGETTGGLQIFNNETAGGRDVAILGNTFLGNVGELVGSSTTSNNLRLRADTAMAAQSVVRGNVFLSEPRSPSFPLRGCSLVGAAVVETGYNLADEASCVFGAQDIEDPAADLSISATSNPVLTRAVIPANASVVVDAWPAADCALDADMFDTSRPLNGDGLNNADCDIGAVEAPLGQILTVGTNLINTGAGVVRSIPSGIECGNVCSAAFASGSTVSLVASPQFGSVFTDWDNDCDAANGICDLTMDQPRNANATFVGQIASGQVDVTVNGAGVVVSDPMSIYCPPACDGNFGAPQPIDLLAVPEPNSTTNWSGACAGVTGETCSLAVLLGSQQAVTVDFTAAFNVLTVSVVGSGQGSVTSAPTGIDCPGDCVQRYSNGQSVTLTAQPAMGGVFAGWTGACSGIAPCTVTMDQAQSVSAEFQSLNQLNVIVNGAGQVSSQPGSIICPGQCSELFDAQSSVALTAVPTVPAGMFLGWEDCPFELADGRCSVAMFADRTVTATFTELPEQLFADGFEVP